MASTSRFRASLEAREKNRQILVDTLEAHCATARRKHTAYRIFLVMAIIGVGYLWLDRMPKRPKTLENAMTVVSTGKIWQQLQQEARLGKNQLITAPSSAPAAPLQALANHRYDSSRAQLPPELTQAHSAKTNAQYVAANPAQENLVPMRGLASTAGYVAATASEQARLPIIKRREPIPNSRYIWVGRSVPLRLVVDNLEYPDLMRGD